MTDLLHPEIVTGGERQSRLSTVIFLLLCLIPVGGTMLFGAVDNTTWILIVIAWAAIVLAWLAECWNAGGLLYHTSRLQLPLLGLLVVGMIQLLIVGSLDPYATRFFVIQLVVYCTFFAAALAFISSERRLSRLVGGIVIFGALLAFFGILQRLSNPEGIYGMRETPNSIPFGPYVNQHHFAALMEMTGGLTMGLLMGRDIGREKRTMLAAALVVMLVAVVSTGSRGGLLAFIAVGGLAFAMAIVAGRRSNRSRSSLLPVVVGAVTLAAIALGMVLFIGGDESLLRGIGAVNADSDISSGRLHFWPVAIAIFFDNPIFGAGFDAFGVAFTLHDSWSGTMRVEQAHNEYLQILADAGVAGFICITGFIFLLFKQGLNRIAGTDGWMHSASIGALAGCTGILVHSFFDFPLRTSSNAFFFLLMAVIATAAVTPALATKSRKRRTNQNR